MFFAGLVGSLAAADPVLRVASFNAELYRDGPGLLLEDLRDGDDPQVEAVIAVIAKTQPDVLALQGFDWDYDGLALQAFQTRLSEAGMELPHAFANRPNRGMPTGLDMDGDGRTGDPADAQGFGSFTGQGGMAVLSRWPIEAEAVQDFSALLWRDLPGAMLPTHPDGRPFPTQEALDHQRLSSTAHWVVPIILSEGVQFDLLTFHAGPPVFDGPEDRNGLRNHDETALWLRLLEGSLAAPPAGPFVLAGATTLDPVDGEGRKEALQQLLELPVIQDPQPASAGAATMPDQGHGTPNAQDTVDWPPPGPGRMRVDYVLPSIHWAVLDSGVFWPPEAHPDRALANAASRHKLVWVDLRLGATP